MSSPTDLSTLTNLQLDALTQADITAFTPEQIGTLEYRQVQYMLNNSASDDAIVTYQNNIFSLFSDSQFQKLKPGVINEIMSRGLYKFLTLSQANSMTDAQFLTDLHIIFNKDIDFSNFPARLLSLIPTPWNWYVPRTGLSSAQNISLGSVPDNLKPLEEIISGLMNLGREKNNLIDDPSFTIEEVNSKLTAEERASVKSFFNIGLPYGPKARYYYSFNPVEPPTDPSGNSELMPSFLISVLLPEQITYIPINVIPTLIQIRDIPLISPEQIQAFTTTQLKAFTPEQIRALTPEQFAVMSSAQIYGFTLSQREVITPSQLSILDSDQIKSLTSTQISALTSSQISAMSREQISALTPLQLQGFTRVQLNTFTSDQLTYFTSVQVKGFTPEQISALTPARFKALATSQLSALTREQIAVLSPAQLNQLTPAQIKTLTPAQAIAITPAQVAEIAPAQAAAIVQARVPFWKRPSTIALYLFFALLIIAIIIYFIKKTMSK